MVLLLPLEGPMNGCHFQAAGCVPLEADVGTRCYGMAARDRVVRMSDGLTGPGRGIQGSAVAHERCVSAQGDLVCAPPRPLREPETAGHTIGEPLRRLARPSTLLAVASPDGGVLPAYWVPTDPSRPTRHVQFDVMSTCGAPVRTQVKMTKALAVDWRDPHYVLAKALHDHRVIKNGGGVNEQKDALAATAKEFATHAMLYRFARAFCEGRRGLYKDAIKGPNLTAESYETWKAQLVEQLDGVYLLLRTS